MAGSDDILAQLFPWSALFLILILDLVQVAVSTQTILPGVSRCVFVSYGIRRSEHIGLFHYVLIIFHFSVMLAWYMMRIVSINRNSGKSEVFNLLCDIIFS